jgi:hypothetical protein
MQGARYLDRETLRNRGQARLTDGGFVKGDHLRIRGEGRQMFLELGAEPSER